MQAKARYFSIAVLSRAAKSGDDKPLLEATRAVASSLSTTEAASEGRLATFTTWSTSS